MKINKKFNSFFNNENIQNNQKKENLKNFNQKFKINNNFFSRKIFKDLGIVKSESADVNNDIIKKDKESTNIFYHVIVIKNKEVNYGGPYKSKPFWLDFDKIKKEIEEDSNWSMLKEIKKNENKNKNE